MITISHLTKTYGDFRAVDDVTFTAQPGRVTGFLGPNGAGKSTTMRIMVGLTPATTGEATILGRHFSELPNPGREVGVLLDASAQHAGRTGREILTLAQRTMRMPKSRVDEMLEVVSLTDEEAGRRVRDYSLGMRQRLGIAAALIGNPEVLILDEPANGLDPAGIRWMRDLLRGYADQGGTVLLSSHLLHEIEVIADDIVVIGQGRVVAQGTKHELLEAAGTYVRATDPGPPRGGTGRGRPPGRAEPAGPAHRRLHRPGRRGGPGRRHRAARAPARRRRRSRGDVPRPHLRHPARQQRSRRSSSMSTATIPVTTTSVGSHVRAERPTYEPIPMRTIMGVELRKMFDTRSGFWLMASVVILAVIATGAVILFAPDDEISYGSFAGAIGIPMTIVLPIIAALSITSEWSQRTGLTTFTMVPSRSRVVLAKLLDTVLVGIVSILVALAVGALGNVVGSQLAGVPTTWDLSVSEVLYILGGNGLGLLMGFTLGVLFRNSAAAIVGYFVYAMVLPTLSALLAGAQDWYADAQPWVDFQWNQTGLFDGGYGLTEWSQLAITGTIWLRAPPGLRPLAGAAVRGEVARLAGKARPTGGRAFPRASVPAWILCTKRSSSSPATWSGWTPATRSACTPATRRWWRGTWLTTSTTPGSSASWWRARATTTGRTSSPASPARSPMRRAWRSSGTPTSCPSTSATGPTRRSRACSPTTATCGAAAPST